VPCFDCSCEAFDRKTDAPKWLDAPDKEGIWVRAYKGQYKEAGRVQDGFFAGMPLKHLGTSDWMYMGPIPTAPPPPLPASKQVTVKAKVSEWPGNPYSSRWVARVFFDGASRDSAHLATQHEAAAWVRKSYGIEPEVMTE
jgi:hypothetical protein